MEKVQQLEPLLIQVFNANIGVSVRYALNNRKQFTGRLLKIRKLLFNDLTTPSSEDKELLMASNALLYFYLELIEGHPRLTFYIKAIAVT